MTVALRPVVKLDHGFKTGMVEREPPVLSARQVECLSWAARGKTRFETATILGIGNATVKEHIKEAARKLDASNTTQAVAIACMRGLIQP